MHLRSCTQAQNPHSGKINVYVDWLSQLWRTLQACCTARTAALDNALTYQRFRADCTDAVSWLTDKVGVPMPTCAWRVCRRHCCCLVSGLVDVHVWISVYRVCQRAL